MESPYQDQYYLAVAPMKGGDPVLTSEESEATVADFRWEADSEHLLLVIHDHGQSKLVRMHREGGQPQVLLDGERWVHGFSASDDGERVALAISTPTQPEELFILNNKAHDILKAHGIKVYKTFVGEYATSMEMAGASLSLLRLNDEFKKLLDAPAFSPFLPQWRQP